MSEIYVSAPGKVILHGEHSVVYGKRAIACAIGSRITVKVISSPPRSDGIISVLMPSLHQNYINVEIGKFCRLFEGKQEDDHACSHIEQFCYEVLSNKCNEFMRLALSCILYAYYKVFLCSDSVASPQVSLVIDSQLPIGSGLGSSAAFNTSVGCAFLIISGKVSSVASQGFIELSNEDDLNKINELAYNMEKIVHKTPSGIDNSVATYGGAVSFLNGELTRLAKMPKLQLLIVDTQVPRNTKVLVSNVKDFLTKFPDVVNPILDAMHNITLRSEKLLEDIYDDPQNPILLNNLGKLIETNQCLLSSIGVGHATLNRICSVAKSYGFSAKLTGAGGGGCAIIFMNSFNGNEIGSKVEEMKKVLTDENFVCREAELGAVGIMMKSTL